LTELLTVDAALPFGAAVLLLVTSALVRRRLVAVAAAEAP
jgi:hypothetical protein